MLFSTHNRLLNLLRVVPIGFCAQIIISIVMVEWILVDLANGTGRDRTGWVGFRTTQIWPRPKLSQPVTESRQIRVMGGWHEPDPNLDYEENHMEKCRVTRIWPDQNPNAGDMNCMLNCPIGLGHAKIYKDLIHLLLTKRDRQKQIQRTVHVSSS